MTDGVFDILTIPRKWEILWKWINFNLDSLQLFLDYNDGVSKVTLQSVEIIEISCIDKEIKDEIFEKIEVKSSVFPNINEIISEINSVFPSVKEIQFLSKELTSNNFWRIFWLNKDSNLNRYFCS